MVSAFADQGNPSIIFGLDVANLKERLKDWCDEFSSDEPLKRPRLMARTYVIETASFHLQCVESQGCMVQASDHATADSCQEAAHWHQARLDKHLEQHLSPDLSISGAKR